ncbi:hypothetical protein GCK72_004672 [Caenorhabditis remanei]|uniref:Uncharacterized protein n=1 Tax=Caenorhabditis remanei TaxID=31234 RepID=A0A6A5HEL2_CAERE|nr:hypothetical protein GCK72_004672 [Caenorhabditis remanei]KAF1764722.1 hypothetical protein GCK72_004672 [Caenorhabditis remanei]
MNPTEMQYQVLAMMIKARVDSEVITKSINLLSNHPISTDVFDRCNLPCLIMRYASHIGAARDLLLIYRTKKTSEMKNDQSQLLETFYKANMTIFEGAEPPAVLNEFLRKMLEDEVEEYVRLAYRLLTDLDFHMEFYLNIIARARRDRLRIFEAGWLVDKVEKILRYEEIVDEDMDSDVEDEDQEFAGPALPPMHVVDENLEEEEAPEEDSDADDSFDWVSEDEEDEDSDESGYEDESDEMVEERLDEEEEEFNQFGAAIGEVFMRNLARSLKSGNERKIESAIEAISHFQLHPSVYRKYEICRLIFELSFHNFNAMVMFIQLERREEEVYSQQKMEVFHEFLNYLDSDNIDSVNVYKVMAEYLKDKRFEKQVVKVFLNGSVTREQFEDWGIKEHLLNSTEKSDDVNELIEKIKKL